MTSDSQNTTTRRVKKIDIPPVISVSDLADNMEVNPVEVVKGLMRGGYMFAVNDVIDRDIASIVVQLFGFQANEIEDEISGPASLTVDKNSENPDAIIKALKWITNKTQHIGTILILFPIEIY